MADTYCCVPINRVNNSTAAGVQNYLKLNLLSDELPMVSLNTHFSSVWELLSLILLNTIIYLFLPEMCILYITSFFPILIPTLPTFGSMLTILYNRLHNVCRILYGCSAEINNLSKDYPNIKMMLNHQKIT